VLAVVIDLGWPWWVTTVIACAVALLALYALLRVHAGALRALAALILLEAVAVAVIAPYVDDSDEHAATVATPGAPISRGGYARLADSNCRELDQLTTRLGDPKTPQGIERMLDQLLPKYWQTVVAQGDLRPPNDEAADVRRWVHAMADVGSDYEHERAAASRRDVRGIARQIGASVPIARRQRSCRSGSACASVSSRGSYSRS
jgi:hypothetical protein